MTVIVASSWAGLLTVDLLLFVGVLILAIKLLQHAKVTDFPTIPDDSPPQAEWTPDAPLPSTPIRPEAAAPPPESSPKESAFSDLFADPIDGSRFLAGQEVMICRCGTGYHMETWEWIQEQCAGKCVHCGQKNLAHKQRIQDSSYLS